MKIKVKCGYNCGRQARFAVVKPNGNLALCKECLRGLKERWPNIELTLMPVGVAIKATGLLQGYRYTCRTCLEDEKGDGSSCLKEPTRFYEIYLPWCELRCECCVKEQQVTIYQPPPQKK